jgi:TonB-dependent receptor
MRRSNRHSCRLPLCASVAAAAFASQAWAQDTVDTVVITGPARQYQQAIAVKRQTGVVSDSVTADDVGSLPDFGLGEALVRIPGVSTIINNARGEAQLFTLRGLNADYNAVQIDGFSLPATETTRRNVSLDVIPSSLASRVDVFKTRTADMTGNAIGGVANLRTRSAFDHEGLFVAGRADWAKYENTREIRDSTPSGQAELAVSNRFGPQNHFGYVLSASYFRRDSASLDSAVDTYSFYDASGAVLSNTDPGVGAANAVPDRRRWLYYDNLRQRYGAFGKLEYDDGKLAVHLTGADFRHLNDEERQSNILIKTGTATGVTATSGSVAAASAQADLAHYNQKRRIRYVEAGLSYRASERSVVTAGVNSAVSTYRQDALLETYRAASSTALGYDYSYAVGGFPDFRLRTPAAYYDATRYQQSEHTRNADDNREKVLAFKAGYAFNLDQDAEGLGFGAGVEGRFLDRTYDFSETSYAPIAPANFLLSETLSATTIWPYNGAGQHLMLIDEDKAVGVFDARSALYKLNSNFTARNLGSDYTVSEDVRAAYLMGAYARGPLRADFGLRYEDTRLQTGSYNATTKAGVTTYAWATQSQHYGKLLPLLNLKYDLTPDLKLRLGYGRALGRPNYDLLAARQTVARDTASVTISGGNPNLKPRMSDNYDLSLEYYLGRGGAITAAVFRKAIKNEILTTTTTDTQMIDGISTVVVTRQPVNGSSASVNGLELGYTLTHLDMLPKPLDGLGFSINGTFLDMDGASVTMASGATRKLPALVEAAKTTVNAALFYEYRGFNAKLAYNHVSPILWVVATDAPLNDRYYGAADTYDLQFQYRFAPGLTLVAQGKNLTNERPQRLAGPNQNLLREELDNGRSYWVGLKFKY